MTAEFGRQVPFKGNQTALRSTVRTSPGHTVSISGPSPDQPVLNTSPSGSAITSDGIGTSPGRPLSRHGDPFSLADVPRRLSTARNDPKVSRPFLPGPVSPSDAIHTTVSLNSTEAVGDLRQTPGSSHSGYTSSLRVDDSVILGNLSDTVLSPEPRYRTTPLQLYGPRMPLPFKVPLEALLFQHYMENLASLLDITDIQRHFAVDVPERALFCPVLLYALLAFSARHLSRTSDFDPTVADHYHHECVALMIPMLDQKELVADETLFAACVILRAFEETNESKPGAEPERHLTGTSVFANAQLEFQTWGGLGHAAFWVFVRQDIYMSLLSQSPLKVDLKVWEERLSFDLGFDETSDCTWANRMVWIVAEIIGFCFGDKTSSRWEDPRIKTERWNASRPKSFDPIFSESRDPNCGRYFPEIRLGHPWHGRCIPISQSRSHY